MDGGKCYGEGQAGKRCVWMWEVTGRALALPELGSHCRALSKRASQSGLYFNWIPLGATQTEQKRGKEKSTERRPCSHPEKTGRGQTQTVAVQVVRRDHPRCKLNMGQSWFADRTWAETERKAKSNPMFCVHVIVYIFKITQFFYQIIAVPCLTLSNS